MSSLTNSSRIITKKSKKRRTLRSNKRGKNKKYKKQKTKRKTRKRKHSRRRKKGGAAVVTTSNHFTTATVGAVCLVGACVAKNIFELLWNRTSGAAAAETPAPAAPSYLFIGIFTHGKGDIGDPQEPAEYFTLDDIKEKIRMHNNNNSNRYDENIRLTYSRTTGIGNITFCGQFGVDKAVTRMDPNSSLTVKQQQDQIKTVLEESIIQHLNKDTVEEDYLLEKTLSNHPQIYNENEYAHNVPIPNKLLETSGVRRGSAFDNIVWWRTGGEKRVIDPLQYGTLWKDFINKMNERVRIIKLNDLIYHILTDEKHTDTKKIDHIFLIDLSCGRYENPRTARSAKRRDRVLSNEYNKKSKKVINTLLPS
jgi:hypothetical protein